MAREVGVISAAAVVVVVAGERFGASRDHPGFNPASSQLHPASQTPHRPTLMDVPLLQIIFHAAGVKR
jgi:hypothetical protein